MPFFWGKRCCGVCCVSNLCFNKKCLWMNENFSNPVVNQYIYRKGLTLILFSNYIYRELVSGCCLMSLVSHSSATSWRGHAILDLQRVSDCCLMSLVSHSSATSWRGHAIFYIRLCSLCTRPTCLVGFLNNSLLPFNLKIITNYIHV